jgi:hypothetical protein
MDGFCHPVQPIASPGDLQCLNAAGVKKGASAFEGPQCATREFSMKLPRMSFVFST